MSEKLNEDFNVSTLDSDEMPFDEDNDTIVVEMSSRQYNCVHSVLDVMDSLYQENEQLKDRISKLMTVIGIYGLVFNDEVFSKLKESGFKILVLDENEGLQDFVEQDDDALLD